MALSPLSTETMRSAYADFRCDTSTMTRVPFPGDGHDWDLLVATPTAEAWRVFTRVMARHDVLFLESIGGTYSCRFISGTTKWSPHAFGIALDLNPSENPQQSPLTTVFTDDFIAAVEALVTGSGRRVFQWGGRWSGDTTPDPMHFQIGATPDELATGIIDPLEEPMPLNADDLETIRAIVREEIADSQAAMRDELARNLAAVKNSIARNNATIRQVLTEPRDASPIGRAVFNYTRGFSPDNVAKLLRRIDRNSVPATPRRRGRGRPRGEEGEETFTRGSPEGSEGEPVPPTGGETRRRGTTRSSRTPPVG